MRFFTTLQRAGRLEFILVAAAIYGLTWALLHYVLELRIAVDSISLDTSLLSPDSFGFDSGAVGIVAIGLTILVFLSVMNAGRRLKDLDQSGAFALLMLIPGVNLLLTLYLATATATRDTYTPYGKNPYDPNSWIAPEATTGSSGIQFQGEEIFLPGEEQQAA